MRAVTLFPVWVAARSTQSRALQRVGRWSVMSEARATDIEARLEYLRGEIRAERISYGEIFELQDMAEHIDPGDVELLEWAGVPEYAG